MRTRREIVEALYADSWGRKCANAYCYHERWRDDFEQELYLHILTLKAPDERSLMNRAMARVRDKLKRWMATEVAGSAGTGAVVSAMRRGPGGADVGTLRKQMVLRPMRERAAELEWEGDDWK